MPSSYNRPSPGGGRQTHTGRSGSSRGPQKPSPPRAGLSAAAEFEDRTVLITELNKMTAERDRYFCLYEQANKKVAASYAEKVDLKNQVQVLKEDMATLKPLKDENDALKHKVHEYKRELQESKQEAHESKREIKRLTLSLESRNADYAALKADHDGLVAALETPAASPSGVHGVRMKLPERRKPHTSPSKREAKDERAHKSDKESRDQKVDKERLGRRFQGQRPARPQSFIEPWGLGSLDTGREFAQFQLQPLPTAVAFSPLPCTATLPGSSLFVGALHHDDDGNYHPHPLPR